MKTRTLLVLCISAVAIALVRVPVVAQRGTTQSGSSSAAAAGYKAPRTPWGDPDLQGVFTNSNEYMTPLERPDAFAGMRLEDRSGE